jgi:hypothetical protein
MARRAVCCSFRTPHSAFHTGNSSSPGRAGVC